MNKDDMALDARPMSFQYISPYVTCPGCGEAFKGERGLRAHQSQRFVTMDCRPRPAKKDPE